MAQRRYNRWQQFKMVVEWDTRNLHNICMLNFNSLYVCFMKATTTHHGSRENKSHLLLGHNSLQLTESLDLKKDVPKLLEPFNMEIRYWHYRQF